MALGKTIHRMIASMLLGMILLGATLSFAWTWGSDNTWNNPTTMMGAAAGTAYWFGMYVKINGTQQNLTQVDKYASDTATYFWLLNESRTPLGNWSFSGNTVYPNVVLEANREYYFMLGNYSGNRYHNDTPSFPYQSNIGFNVTGGLYRQLPSTWGNASETFAIMVIKTQLNLTDAGGGETDSQITWSNMLSNVTNNTAVNTGTPINISVLWNSNATLSMFANSSKVNTSGTFTNSTWTAIGVTNWTNFTYIFPSEQGSNLTIKVYANDTNHTNVTGIWYWYNVSVVPPSCGSSYGTETPLITQLGSEATFNSSLKTVVSGGTATTNNGGYMFINTTTNPQWAIVQTNTSYDNFTAKVFLHDYSVISANLAFEARSNNATPSGSDCVGATCVPFANGQKVGINIQNGNSNIFHYNTSGVIRYCTGNDTWGSTALNFNMPTDYWLTIMRNQTAYNVSVKASTYYLYCTIALSSVNDTTNKDYIQFGDPMGSYWYGHMSLQNFSLSDLTVGGANCSASTYSNLASNVTNNTQVKTSSPISFSAQWSDVISLSHYMNSSNINNSGWANGTWTAFSAGNWSNYTILFPSAETSNLSFRIYANNSLNNQTVTPAWFFWNTSYLAKTASIVNLSLNDTIGNVSYTYGQMTKASGWMVLPSDLSGSLFRNGTSVASGQSSGTLMGYINGTENSADINNSLFYGMSQGAGASLIISDGKINANAGSTAGGVSFISTKEKYDHFTVTVYVSEITGANAWSDIIGLRNVNRTTNPGCIQNASLSNNGDCDGAFEYIDNKAMILANAGFVGMWVMQSNHSNWMCGSPSTSGTPWVPEQWYEVRTAARDSSINMIPPYYARISANDTAYNFTVWKGSTINSTPTSSFSCTFKYQNMTIDGQSGIDMNGTNGSVHVGTGHTEWVWWGGESMKLQNFTLKNNSASSGSSTPGTETIRLGAGMHNYTQYFAGNENYTDAFLTYWANVTPVSAAVLAFPVTQTINYTQSVNEYCYSNASACSIYRNNTLISNNSNEVLGVGYYQFKANLSDTQNYTNTISTIENLTVNKASPSLNLNLTPESGTIGSGIPVTITCNAPSQLSVNMYSDTAQVSNPLVTSFNTTGVYNYTCNTTGNTNYTSGDITKNFTVVALGQLNIFGVYDERNTSNQLNFDVQVYNSSYSASSTNITAYSNNLVRGYLTIVISAAGYGTRYYNANVSSVDYYNMTGYLLNSSLGTTVQFTIKNQNGNTIEGANVTVSRLFTNWTMVSSTLSDSAGVVPFFADQTANYKVNVAKSGYDPKEFTMTLSSTSYDVILSGIAYTGNYTPGLWENISYYVSPSGAGITNKSTVFNFTINSTDSRLEWWGMRVADSNGTTLCWVNETNPFGGSANCTLDLTNHAGENYTYQTWFKKTGFAAWFDPLIVYVNRWTKSGLYKILSDVGAMSPIAVGILALIISIMSVGVATTSMPFGTKVGSGFIMLMVLGVFIWGMEAVNGAGYIWNWGIFLVTAIAIAGYYYLKGGW